MTRNEQLLNTAKEAVEAFFGDTDVSPETTLEGLEELQSIIDGHVESIQSDIKSRK